MEEEQGRGGEEREKRWSPTGGEGEGREQVGKGRDGRGETGSRGRGVGRRARGEETRPETQPKTTLGNTPTQQAARTTGVVAEA